MHDSLKKKEPFKNIKQQTIPLSLTSVDSYGVRNTLLLISNKLKFKQSVKNLVSFKKYLLSPFNLAILILIVTFYLLMLSPLTWKLQGKIGTR